MFSSVLLFLVNLKYKEIILFSSHFPPPHAYPIHSLLPNTHFFIINHYYCHSWLTLFSWQMKQPRAWQNRKKCPQDSVQHKYKKVCCLSHLALTPSVPLYLKYTLIFSLLFQFFFSTKYKEVCCLSHLPPTPSIHRCCDTHLFYSNCFNSWLTGIQKKCISSRHSLTQYHSLPPPFLSRSHIHTHWRSLSLLQYSRTTSWTLAVSLQVRK